MNKISNNTSDKVEAEGSRAEIEKFTAQFSAMGIYFIFLRPSLLPKDLRYMNTSLSAVQNNISNLSGWLQNVFWVMGGYILTTGMLSVYVAQTTFRTRTNGSFVMVLIAGISSIGLMAVVNFIIASDFK